MTPMERIEGELNEAHKRIAELEYLLARQAKAAQQGMDAVKSVASYELKQAKRLRAECSPEALESERAANALLTERVAELEGREQVLAAHVESIRYVLVDAKRCVAVVAHPSIYRAPQYQPLAKRVMQRIESIGKRCEFGSTSL